MKDRTQKERFIELRAQGKSFADIAEEIGVSKTTLIAWSHEMQEQIYNLRAIHDEALLEKYRITKRHELETLSRQIGVIEKELEQRSLADVSTDKLYGILFKLLNEARTERKPLTLQRIQDNMVIDEPTKTTWEA